MKAPSEAGIVPAAAALLAGFGRMWAGLGVLVWAWVVLVALTACSGRLGGQWASALAPWAVVCAAGVALSRTVGRWRRVWWAIAHAGAHLPVLSGQIAGWWLIPALVVAVAASVGTHVAARPDPAPAWFAWMATALLVLGAVARTFGGAS